MSKDKGSKETKKPKADKNAKPTGKVISSYKTEIKTGSNGQNISAYTSKNEGKDTGKPKG